jgi:hypothetical protein
MIQLTPDQIDHLVECAKMYNADIARVKHEYPDIHDERPNLADAVIFLAERVRQLTAASEDDRWDALNR